MTSTLRKQASTVLCRRLSAAGRRGSGPRRTPLPGLWPLLPGRTQLLGVASYPPITTPSFATNRCCRCLDPRRCGTALWVIEGDAADPSCGDSDVAVSIDIFTVYPLPPPTSQHGSIFDPPLGVFWWFGDAGSAHSVHGPSFWPARRFGTLSLSLSNSLRDPDLGRDNFRTSAENAFIYTAYNVLEMFPDDTLYKLTYLLTYFLGGD